MTGVDQVICYGIHWAQVNPISTDHTCLQHANRQILRLHDYIMLMAGGKQRDTGSEANMDHLRMVANVSGCRLANHLLNMSCVTGFTNEE